MEVWVLKDEKLTKVLEDKEFLKKVINAPDVNTVKLLFEEKGIILSDDDINKIGIMVKDNLSHPEREFDNVIGGIDATFKIKNIAYAISAVCIAGSIAYGSRKFGQAVDTINGKINNVKPTWLGRTILGI